MIRVRRYWYFQIFRFWKGCCLHSFLDCNFGAYNCMCLSLSLYGLL
uniref:Uncharacterized protein n=1 Tax=Arundo donax TaxID=35708 RepID=A0A0A9CYL0_ARUDO